MRLNSRKRTRLTGFAMLLAAGFFLLPVTADHIHRLGYATAWAGDQDCGVPQGYGTTNPFTANRSTCGFASRSDVSTSYSALDTRQSGTIVPCQSCRMGANGTGYEPQYVAPCHGQWCGGK